MTYGINRLCRYLSRVTREDRIRNKYARRSIGVTSIVGKMRKNRPSWFGHVMRKEETKAVRAIMKINVEGKKR